MGVLSSQVLLRPSDRDRSRRCYRDMPGLTVDMQIGQFCKRFNGRSFSAAVFEHVEHACVIRCEHADSGRAAGVGFSCVMPP
jgi:hypothetical protein